MSGDWHTYCYLSGMDKITFSADRDSLTEGEVIEIRWNCPDADRAELRIDNGYKATVLPIDTDGTKRFRLNRSKGKTKLTITAWKMDKQQSKTLKIKVKEMPVTHSETIDRNGRRVGRTGEWWKQRVLPKWQTYRAKRKATWQALPPEKRIAARLLTFIALLLLLISIAPWLLSIGLLAIIGYLVWVLMRK